MKPPVQDHGPALLCVTRDPGLRGQRIASTAFTVYALPTQHGPFRFGFSKWEHITLEKRKINLRPRHAVVAWVDLRLERQQVIALLLELLVEEQPGAQVTPEQDHVGRPLTAVAESMEARG